MSKISKYETLLGLPLFQGMSRNDIGQVAETVGLSFTKYAKGKKIINSGDACKGFVILIRGEAILRASSDSYTYSVEEFVSQPMVIQPERLFGLTQRYTVSFTSNSECTLIYVKKEDVLYLLDNYEIFRLNFINMLSTVGQKLAGMPWHNRPEEVKTKIIYFFKTHCIYPAGDKVFYISMQQLACEVGESRLNVSKALNHLHEKGFINLRRCMIHVIGMERMISL